MAFHPGELEVQSRAGVADRAARLLGMFDREVPPAAIEFLAAQPWIVLGAADADDRMWATVLYGHPGFITTPSPSTVHIAAHPLPGDPLVAALSAPGEVGGLALEPGTRRRMRLNGRASPTPDGLNIALEQVYSNCPKYIATRRPVAWQAETQPPTRVAGTTLDARAQELLATADTAFVATRAPGHGVDASHRGGNPGFLRVIDEHTVVWPDYMGNSMFNTLGNIALDPATGLTVVDPPTGTTLHLSGRSEILWEDGGFPGAQRLVRLTVDAAVRFDHAAPLRWELVHAARNPPLEPPRTGKYG
jgi:predicted pyridoxine 5'-phosphate oxidase superfamily flavin-nucleotide-binding protein